MLLYINVYTYDNVSHVISMYIRTITHFVYIYELISKFMFETSTTNFATTMWGGRSMATTLMTLPDIPPYHKMWFIAYNKQKRLDASTKMLSWRDLSPLGRDVQRLNFL